MLQNCWDVMVTRGDTLNGECINKILTLGLSTAIMLGSAFLQVPLIRNTLKARSVENLSEFSLYSQVFIPVAMVSYAVLQGHPLSNWGENLCSLAQNMIVVMLYWRFATPKLSTVYVMGVFAVLVGVTCGCFFLPQRWQHLLPLSTLPLLLIARVPQIMLNYTKKSTGTLSAFPFVLIVFGSAARVFTTVKQVGWDWSILVGYFLGGAFAAVLAGQIWYYSKGKKKD